MPSDVATEISRRDLPSAAVFIVCAPLVSDSSYLKFVLGRVLSYRTCDSVIRYWVCAQAMIFYMDTSHSTGAPIFAISLFRINTTGDTKSLFVSSQ